MKCCELETCKKVLVRRADERADHFDNRRFCGRICANRHTRNIAGFKSMRRPSTANNSIVNGWLYT